MRAGGADGFVGDQSRLMHGRQTKKEIHVRAGSTWQKGIDRQKRDLDEAMKWAYQ